MLVTAPDAHGRWLAGSDRALYVPRATPNVSGAARSAEPAGADEGFDRLRWERIERAEWDQEAEVLRITEFAPFGERSPQRVLRFDRSERLLQLIRERVTASVVFSSHVPVREGLGVKVVARRPPGTNADLIWSVVFDEGLDPADPEVKDAAERALRDVRAEVETA